MATDLEDKQGTYDDTAGDQRSDDIVQQHYDDQFKQLTSPEHFAKDGVEKSASPEQLKGAEESGAGATAMNTAGGLGAEAGIAGGAIAESGLFNPAGEAAGGLGKVKNLFWGSSFKRKSTIGGSIAGISIGGLMFGAIIGSGPFEFIHLAQLLTQFHFASIQDASDDRTSKLFRFIHYTQGKPELSRMGVVGNKLANGIEAKMNATGIESAYGDKFGNLDGYVVDSDFKGMSNDEIKQYFKDNYNVTLTDKVDSTGKSFLFADATDQGYFKNRAMIRSMMQESGYSKISSALGARIMGRRAGVSWHPLKKLDRKVTSALDSWWKNRNSEIENGAEPDINAETSPDADKNATSDQQAGTAEAAGSAEDITKTASTGDVDGTKSSIAGKIGIGGAALVGVACLAHSVADHSATLKQAEVVLPMMRMGVEAITVGNQVMNGEDVSTDELGKLSQNLSDTDGDWSNAQSIQAEEGQQLTGVDATSTMKSVGQAPPFQFLTQGVLGTTLGGLCSTAGQGILTIVSFLGGPITATVTTAIGLAISPIENSFEGELAQWLVGKAIDPSTLAGPDYGNAVNYGARLAADDQAIAAGGTALSTTQSAQLKTTETLASQQQFDSESLAYRVFNPDDNRTLVSHLMDSVSPSTTQNIASLVSGFTHIGSNIFSSFGSIFNGVTHAAPPTPYDYGFPEYGFSEDDLNNPLVENPYQNADYVTDLLNTSCLNPDGTANNSCDYIQSVQKCFGVSLVLTPDPDNNNTPTWDVSGGSSTTNMSNLPSGCADANGPSDYPDSDWLRLRFFIFDTENMESIGCYENDTESCDDIDMSNGNDGAVSYNLEQVISSKTNTVATTTDKSHVSKVQKTSVAATDARVATDSTFWRNIAKGTAAYAAMA